MKIFVIILLFVLLSSIVLAANQTVELNVTVKNSLKQTFEKYKPTIIGFALSLAIIIIGFIIYLLLRKVLS